MFVNVNEKKNEMERFLIHFQKIIATRVNFFINSILSIVDLFNNSTS